MPELVFQFSTSPTSEERSALWTFLLTLTLERLRWFTWKNAFFHHAPKKAKLSYQNCFREVKEFEETDLKLKGSIYQIKLSKFIAQPFFLFQVQQDIRNILSAFISPLYPFSLAEKFKSCEKYRPQISKIQFFGVLLLGNHRCSVYQLLDWCVWVGVRSPQKVKSETSNASIGKCWPQN